MNKQDWTNRAYQLLCDSQGAPENTVEERNLREVADGMADEYYDHGLTPEQAHQEEVEASA